MLRLLYRRVLRLHPARFRERFAEEMLSIFDHVEGKGAAAELVADAFISLVRQWTVRSEYWEEKATMSVPAGAGGLPAFCTLESFRPQKSALIGGVVLTWIACSAVFLALNHSKIHYVYVPSIDFDSTTSDAGRPTSTSNLPSTQAPVRPSTPARTWPSRQARTRPRIEANTRPSGQAITGSGGNTPRANRLRLGGLMPPEADSPARVFESQGQARLNASGKLSRILTPPLVQSLSQPIAPASKTKESLFSYMGIYSIDAPNKFTVLITVEDGHLAIEIPGEQKSMLVPVGGTRFAFSETQADWIEFVRQGSGAVYDLRIYRNGSEFRGHR